MKIASALPKDDTNGLTAIQTDLLRRPGKAHLIIAEIDCKTITTDVDTNDKEPTIRILRAEAIDDEGAARLVEKILQDRYLRRTNGDSSRLPFGEDDPETDRA